MTRAGSSHYPYLALGVVGIVAFVAMFYILSGFPNLPGETRIGAATLTGTPTLDDFPLVIAEVGETFDAGAAEVTLDEAGKGAVKIVVIVGDTAQIRTLALGESIPVADVTITLVGLREDEADFVVASAVYACPNSREEQTPVCNGESACSNGACRALPVCAQRANGPVASDFERQFYCCDGRLSLVGCGDLPPIVKAAISETGPTSDVVLAIDIMGELQGTNPIPVGLTELFGDVNLAALNDQVLIAVYEGEVAVIIGADLEIDSDADIYARIEEVLATEGVTRTYIQSDELLVTDLHALFPLLVCETDLDCPQIECIQAPCGYSCVAGACIPAAAGGEIA